MLSLAQIAGQVFSSKEAIRKQLERFGIPLREPHKPHGRPAQMRYGKQIRQGKVFPHYGEERVIEAIKEMRKQNMSLRQIASVLSKTKVPTKGCGKRWHPQMVKRILDG